MMGSKVIEKDGMVYRLVPPDGGWGYMLTVPFILFMLVFSVSTCTFGVVYNRFLEETNANSEVVGLLSGAGMLVSSCSSFLSAIPLKRYSYRQVAFVGSAILSMGFFGNIFINSVATFFLFNGIVCPLGNGILCSTVISALNSYFEQRRSIVIGACQLVVGVFGVIAPLVYNFTMKQFGFRITLAITFAQSLLLLGSVFFIRPVDQYMKLEPIPEEDWPHIEEVQPLTSEKNRKHSITIIKETKPEEEHSEIKHKSWSKKVIEFMGLDIFKDLRFVNISMGIAFALTSDMTFMMFFPLHLYHIGWSQEDVAFILSLGAFGDVMGRLIFVIVSKMAKIRSRFVFLYGVAISAILKLILTYMTSKLSLLIISAVLGLTKAMTITLQPLVLAEHVSPEQFPSAIGVNMLACGVAGVPVGSIVGYIRDATDSYIWPFNVLTGLLMLCLIPWVIELSCFSKKKKTIPTRPVK